MYVQNNYSGKCKLAVGNGNLIFISHIGDSLVHIPTTHSHLKLNNIIHVPHITKNLLSKLQFTNDNKVFIEFHCDSCFIKDISIGRVLMRNVLKDELYQVSLSKPVQSSQALSSLLKPCQSVVQPSQSNVYKYYVVCNVCKPSQSHICKPTNSLLSCILQCKPKTTSIPLWRNRLGHPCPSTLSHVILFSIH